MVGMSIVFNGEIYNFREIRNELNERNTSYPWRGGSDTEVLLAAISYWGVRDTLETIERYVRVRGLGQGYANTDLGS